MEKEPFPELKIYCTDFLNDLNSRSECTKCGKSRKFFCYTCYLPVPEIAHKVPSVKLPLKVDIIKHPSEVDGKSTAVHAAVIAPDDVTIYTYPCIPDYDREKVCLVFPCDSSKTLEQLAGTWKATAATDSANNKSTASCFQHKRTVPDGSPQDTNPSKKAKLEDDSVVTKSVKDGSFLEDKVPVTNAEQENKTLTDLTNQDLGLSLRCGIERVVFIDSTWNQTKTICNDERLKGLQCVELKSEKTKFWRHQKDIPDTYLSTVEAIYYFLREFHEHFVKEPYESSYDNLLFFFTFMYKKIRHMYDGGEHLKAYKGRKDKAANK